MFDFLKKKATPFQLAAYIVMETSNYSSGLEDSVNKFLNDSPSFSRYRNRMLDEIQWVIVACGVIAVRLLTEHTRARTTIGEILKAYRLIHENNNQKTVFTPMFLDSLNDRLDNYMVRFNRGATMRDPNQFTLKEGLVDVANESMKYITGETRSTDLTDWDDLLTVQARTQEPDALEFFVRNVIQQFVNNFYEKFKNYKIV